MDVCAEQKHKSYTLASAEKVVLVRLIWFCSLFLSNGIARYLANEMLRAQSIAIFCVIRTCVCIYVVVNERLMVKYCLLLLIYKTIGEQLVLITATGQLEEWLCFRRFLHCVHYERKPLQRVELRPIVVSRVSTIISYITIGKDSRLHLYNCVLCIFNISFVFFYFFYLRFEVWLNLFFPIVFHVQYNSYNLSLYKVLNFSMHIIKIISLEILNVIEYWIFIWMTFTLTEWI